MNEKLEKETEKVTTEFIAAKKLFTALDIGNELKKRGVNARQREISPIVRQQYNEGKVYANTGYARTMIPVKDGNAFVYFPLDRDPSEYTEREQKPMPWDPSKPMFSIEAVVSTADNTAVDLNAVVQAYVGSKYSKVCHQPGCRYAARIKPENLTSFVDMNTALSASYRSCRRE